MTHVGGEMTLGRPDCKPAPHLVRSLSYFEHTSLIKSPLLETQDSVEPSGYILAVSIVP